MKKVILYVAIIAILTASVFALTGCSITAETSDNSVSVSVDGETQSTFERILDWIQERIDRVFND